jgi:Flp pilus assembly protein TadD
MLRCRQLLMQSAPLMLFGRAVLTLIGALGALPVQAQEDSDDGPSQPVIQSDAPAGLNSDSINLNAALTRLGRNPRDGQALIDAGQAALAIGDVDAAVGFFNRADQVTPGNSTVKLGLARALVRKGNPFDAIPLFEVAERSGPLGTAAALDRGLAYDLVADNASAQRSYRQALAAGPSDEATRRLAISLAITGDKRGSATTLSPLLTRQDKGAWRARAFALAILGQADEAISIVNGTLPASLASGIAPYMRYMPRLTPAQQAAAANFGQFPRASEIGQDDPRIARYATTGSRRTALASADGGLIPRGEPLGRSKSDRDASRDFSRNAVTNSARATPPLAAPQLAIATADPKTRRIYDTSGFPAFGSPVQAAQPRPTQPLAQTESPATRTVSAPPSTVAPRSGAAQSATLAGIIARSASTSVTAAPLPVPAPVPVPGPVTPSRPAVTVAPVVRTPPSAPAPPVPPVPRRQSLSEAFSDLGRPAADTAPASGSVDIRRIKPARELAPGLAAAAPVTPSHPSRIWVQLATGRDKAALAYDWRRMARQVEVAFKGRRPSTSTWGQANRLLVGPFESEAAAGSFLAQLRRANVDGAFVWTSPAGQVVDALGPR